MVFAVLVSVVIFFFKIKSQKISYFVFLTYSSPPQLQLIPDLPPPYTDNFVSSLSVTNSPLTLLFMYCHMCGLSLELGDQPDSSLLEETESSLCRSYQWMLGCKQDFVCTSPSVLFFLSDLSLGQSCTWCYELIFATILLYPENKLPLQLSTKSSSCNFSALLPQGSLYLRKWIQMHNTGPGAHPPLSLRGQPFKIVFELFFF